MTISDDTIRSVCIIGGGLGGLLLARAFAQNPALSVTVFEGDASSSERQQGFNIGLNDAGKAALCSVLPSAQVALLFDESNIRDFTLLDVSLETLVHFGKGTPMGGKTVVDRWQLKDVLADGVDVHSVLENRKLAQTNNDGKYEETVNDVTAFFTDGTSHAADLLIGADGVFLKVRAQRVRTLEFDELEITGFSATLAHIPIPQTLHPPIPQATPHIRQQQHRLLPGPLHLPNRHTQNPHGRLPPLPPIPHIPFQQNRSQILPPQHPKNFHSPELATLFEFVNPEDVHHPRRLTCVRPGTNILPSHSPPSRVTLIGDAIHPQSPTSGMGANITFQDVVSLAKALDAQERTGAGWRAALDEFDGDMLDRANFATGVSKKNAGLETKRLLEMKMAMMKGKGGVPGFGGAGHEGRSR
ncbi:hypothetical protein HK097_004508 [Rhizophlyctis rosea]|uniref:FAD-binding domain-containing protein n=1 Tax=Rhizophlyctis rosea TaxID=64517 RepID=A0AAD5SH75_9FUNG|nr:hypothetical protein HK097_004508 [Rhizophlyctis rosea]